MEELPSSREDEGILEDVDATTEGSEVEIQSEATRPLSQPSAKKGALPVPIAMEKLIASTVEKKPSGLLLHSGSNEFLHCDWNRQRSLLC